MELFLFILFGLLAVGAALNLLLQHHPINSALSLIVVMMSLAVLYFSLGAELLSVFVIMLLTPGEEDRTKSTTRIASIAGFPGAAAILCLLAFVFLSERKQLGTTHLSAYLSGAVNNITEISHTLFTTLLLPFEVTSILILVAILGAVVLARKEL